MNKYIEFAIFCLLAIYIGFHPFPADATPFLTALFVLSVVFAIVGLFKK